MNNNEKRKLTTELVRLKSDISRRLDMIENLINTSELLPTHIRFLRTVAIETEKIADLNIISRDKLMAIANNCKVGRVGGYCPEYLQKLSDNSYMTTDKTMQLIRKDLGKQRQGLKSEVKDDK